MRAVANTDSSFTTVFDTPAGILEATINQLEEHGDDGVDFTLWGHLASSDLRGAYFTASYNCASRAGRLALKQMRPQQFTTLKKIPPH